jgi:hypothetical protein
MRSSLSVVDVEEVNSQDAYRSVVFDMVPVAFNSRQIQYVDSYRRQKPSAGAQLKQTFARIFRLAA